MEDIYEIFSESIAALTLNKMRTALAILGIIIGIGSVITLVSFGEATQRSIQSQIQSLGANLLTVIPGSTVQGGVRAEAGSAATLTNDDAKAIQTSPQITTISAVSPEVSNRAQLTAGNNNTNVRIVGVTSTYSSVHSITMSEGTFISDENNNGTERVIVLGPQVVQDLFPNGTDPIGQTIRINMMAFRAIGVTASKGGTGFLNQDDTAYIPLNTAQKELLGQTYLNDISVAAKRPAVMTQAQNQIGFLLLARHHLTNPQQADFSIFSQQDILNAASTATSTFTALLSGIAAISLLVGGIGIMNIMLVTVTERTREIGLRKALGATKKLITMQFLLESIILTFTGGIIGIVFGISLSYIYSTLTNSVFVLSTNSIVLAFIVSAGIGVIFGWYPASRASNMQPVEALRYE